MRYNKSLRCYTFYTVFTILQRQSAQRDANIARAGGRLKMQDRKMTDRKMTDKSAGLENAGLENDGQKCNTQNALIDH